MAATLALLVFSVNWAGFLIIIAALPALYECGLRRLRPLVTVVPRLFWHACATDTGIRDGCEAVGRQCVRLAWRVDTRQRDLGPQ